MPQVLVSRLAHSLLFFLPRDLDGLILYVFSVESDLGLPDHVFDLDLIDELLFGPRRHVLAHLHLIKQLLEPLCLLIVILAALLRVVEPLFLAAL